MHLLLVLTPGPAGPSASAGLVGLPWKAKPFCFGMEENRETKPFCFGMGENSEAKPFCFGMGENSETKPFCFGTLGLAS